MRNILFLLIAVTLAFGLTACGNKEDVSSYSGETSSSPSKKGQSVPEELEYNPDGYESPSEHPGSRK